MTPMFNPMYGPQLPKQGPQMPRSPMFDPAQEGKIKQQRLMAQELMRRNAPQQQQVVGGFVVPESPLGAINTAFGQALGAYGMDKANTAEADLAQQRQKLIGEALGKINTDQREAGAMLAQDPTLLAAGLGLVTDANRTDREMMRFERDANLRRELQGMRSGMMVDPDTGELVQNPDVAQKPLPVGALKLQDEITQAMSTSGNLVTDATEMAKRVRAGEVPLEPTGKIEAWGRNILGLSDEQSRGYGDYKTFIEKIRNDSLRLNKGVQTEGDAQRALNELEAAGNDPELTARAMDKIKQINERAVTLQQQRLSDLRTNYGLPQLDVSSLAGQSAVTASPEQQPVSSAVEPPSGAKLIGTSGGKKVYQLPDGSHVMEQ